MRCPVCAQEVNDEAELLACISSHMQQELAKQAQEMQRVYVMMMASQLTMACVSTHSTPQDVVGTFGEVYGLLENLTGKSNVTGEIEEWLRHHRPDTGES